MNDVDAAAKSVCAIARTAALAGLLAGCFGSTKIEGKYRDPLGNTVESLEDGTAIFVINNHQAVWKWMAYEGHRLKLEPNANIFGATTAVCNYDVTEKLLSVTACEYAMQLSRV